MTRELSKEDTSTESAGKIRETYEEYVIRGDCVAMIADPDRTHAWIQSDLTVDVEQ